MGDSDKFQKPFLGIRTRGSQEEMFGISKKLEELMKQSSCSGGQFVDGSESEVTHQAEIVDRGDIQPTFISGEDMDSDRFRTAEILENSQDLTEEEKKLLWDSLFPNDEVPD